MQYALQKFVSRAPCLYHLIYGLLLFYHYQSSMNVIIHRLVGAKLLRHDDGSGTILSMLNARITKLGIPQIMRVDPSLHSKKQKWQH